MEENRTFNICNFLNKMNGTRYTYLENMIHDNPSVMEYCLDENEKIYFEVFLKDYIRKASSNNSIYRDVKFISDVISRAKELGVDYDTIVYSILVNPEVLRYYEPTNRLPVVLRCIRESYSGSSILEYINKPTVYEIICSLNYDQEALKYASSNLKNSKKMVEKLKKHISKYPSAIKYLDAPSQELKNIALEKLPSAIKFIKNQNETDAKLAVSKNPSMIKYIEAKNRTPEVFEAAICNCSSWRWLTTRNFKEYNFSAQEIKRMAMTGDRYLLSLLKYLTIKGVLDVSEETLKLLD